MKDNSYFLSRLPSTFKNSVFLKSFIQFGIDKLTESQQIVDQMIINAWDIDNASDIALDSLGTFLGVQRPTFAYETSQDGLPIARFDIDNAGYDQAVYTDSNEIQSIKSKVEDQDYRKMLKLYAKMGKFKGLQVEMIELISIAMNDRVDFEYTERTKSYEIRILNEKVSDFEYFLLKNHLPNIPTTKQTNVIQP